MKRVADLVDVWFDSGAMPYAQWHYPFENKDLVDKGTAFPADFIAPTSEYYKKRCGQQDGPYQDGPALVKIYPANIFKK